MDARLSYGGLGLAAAVIVFTGVRWWRQGHHVPGLAAFGGGLAAGLLSALCSGGLLGLAARLLTSQATNPLGDKVTGTRALFGPASDPVGLRPEGGVATVVLVVVAVLAWRCCDYQLRRQMSAGAFAGSALGLAAGIAGAAAVTLVPLANWAGAQVLAALH
ncbi:hypothetical protein [Kitasatospora cineracea]|uniref:hypothetical protein n=1 Tax=Kitasatospora cineracea TaxID=88074 RepID=UPI003798AB16